MSSILSKILKVSIASVLCFCVAFSLVSCSNPALKNLDKADQICVSGALTESWIYVFSDEEFVTQMVDIFSEIDVTESDEAVDMMTAGEILNLTFNNGNEMITKVIFDNDNHLCFVAGGQSYEIKSSFNFSYIKSLVDKQIEAFNSES